MNSENNERKRSNERKKNNNSEKIADNIQMKCQSWSALANHVRTSHLEAAAKLSLAYFIMYNLHCDWMKAEIATIHILFLCCLFVWIKWDRPCFCSHWIQRVVLIRNVWIRQISCCRMATTHNQTHPYLYIFDCHRADVRYILLHFPGSIDMPRKWAKCAQNVLWMLLLLLSGGKTSTASI